MVNSTNSDGNRSDTTNQGGKMERNYKDDGSSRDEADWRSKEVEQMKIQETEPWWLRGLIGAMFTQASLASGRSAVSSNPDVGKRKKSGFFVCSLVRLERRQKSDN